MEVLMSLLPLVAAMAVLAGLLHAIFVAMTFTVDAAHVRVRAYGWTVRKVALADIEFAARDWAFWNEHWTNTVNPRRLVLLRRRTGLCRNFLISPADPAAFLAELRAAGVVVKA
jgi:hypothetical protein